MHAEVCYTVFIMKPARELIALGALMALLTGCGASVGSLFGGDDAPQGNSDLGIDAAPATPGAPAGPVGAVNAPQAPLAADTGRYPAQQRYYELTLDGFPAGTRCRVRDARGKSGVRGTGGRIVVRLTGYPSVADVICEVPDLPEFVIDINKWAFTQPRRPGLSPGDVDKVYAAVQFNLAGTKLQPTAEVTMDTAAGKVSDRLVLNDLKPPAPETYGTQPLPGTD